MFAIPGASTTNISGINNTSLLVGTYTTGSISHGFRGDPSGAFTTIDYPGASSTTLFTINNNGVATGEFNAGTSSQGWFTVDAAGNFKTVTVTVPYTLVSIYGINDNSALSGVVNSSTTGYTFAVINADGTVTPVPGYSSSQLLTVPRSLNNSSQMIETAGSYGGTQLADTSGHVTTIPMAHGYGLNNASTIVGFHGSGPNGGDFPDFGQSFDSSGVLSNVLCPRVPYINAPYVQAINDAGVVVGATYILTPLPGQPQVSLSTTSLSFPDTPVGQTSLAQNVVLANSGNARLDVTSISASSSEFQISGCFDPVTSAFTLDPGASCTLSITATPTQTGSRTATVTSLNSAPGSPGQIAVSVNGTAKPPACAISSIAKGPPAQVIFTMQDTNSGLKSIVTLDSANATVNVPTFVSGSVLAQTVTATQTDTTQPSRVDFQVTNVAGGSTTCGAGFGGPELWTGIGGSFSGRVVIFPNASSLPEAFVRGGDHGLWHTTQTSNRGGWSPWESLGGYLVGDPIMVLEDNGVVGYTDKEVFAVGSDGALWHIKGTGGFGSDTWSAWASLGGNILGNPAVGVNKDGRLEVFAVGTDHALWHIAQTSANGPWGSWGSLGGVITSDPAVLTYAGGEPLAGSIEVFVLGADQALWHTYQTSPGGPWSGWASLGGSLTGNPAVHVNTDGRVEVAVRGTDSALWDVAQTASGGPWNGFVSLGGFITSDPALQENGDGRLEAFVRGGDNALWHIAQTSAGGSFAGWATLGGVLANSPAAVRIGSGTLDVFVEGSDTTLWFVTQISPGVWN